ncbi:MAG: EAL domain-containing protein [Magnetococcales bacterium]|nr:EAL domain-containing protein [Magnetococcales bacterium]
MNPESVQILLVEDEKAHVDLIRYAFDAWGNGCLLTVAATLAEAREKLSLIEPNLLITDLALPDGQGSELLPEDTSTLPYPVIVMTSHGDEQTAVDLLKSGVLEYVVKSGDALMEMHRVAERALRQWDHIRARKHSEAELVKSEERFKTLFNTMPTGVAVFEPVNNGEVFILTDLNRAAERINDIRRQKVIGKPLTELFPSAKTSGLAEAFKRVHFSGEREHFPVSIYEEEVLTTWFENDVYRLDSGEIVCIHEDLTDQKRTEDRLRLTAKVFDNTTEGILITNSANKIIDVNQAYCQTTQYSREEVLGKDPGYLKSGRHDINFYAQIWHTLLKTGQWQGEVWNRRKDGELFPSWLTINTARTADGNILHCIGIFSDTTEKKRMEARLTRMAYRDYLTGLPNRLLFKDRLERELKASRRVGRKTALMFLDLDHFKKVNDSLGHATGDKLLQECARRLRGAVREVDTVARMGGDEFTLVLMDVKDEQAVAHVVRKVLEVFEHPFTIDGHIISITVSIGIAMAPSDGQDHDTLTKHADTAMYQAKADGRKAYRFFEAAMNAANLHRLTLESCMRTALEEGEFQLNYQPKVAVSGGQIIGAEALIRWIRPEHGIVSPLDFIPIAEESGLIIPLGEWILETACRDAKTLMDQTGNPFTMAVNLSAIQFLDKKLLPTMERILQETGLPPENLELEITESMVMKDVEKAIDTMSRVREMGIMISVDDFGTGYSSLSYLKRFPIHALKIDRSFVRDIVQDTDDKAIVSAVISLARSLELKVVAEGVEEPEQLTYLESQGCDSFQGYIFSPPVKSDIFSELLKKEQGE